MMARACITTVLASALLAQQQPAPTIRSRTTLVPVDVRVVDAAGKPITDLKKEDFTILEDGKLQGIQLFDARGLVPQPAADATPLLRTRAMAEAIPQLQTRRIFLFLFGRGRHQSADKSIDAIAAFVRERLLPQDRVALLAFNRATDFTGDRAAILSTLERYKKVHEQIEADLTHTFSGIRALLPDTAIPAPIQQQIDAVFRAPGGVQARQVPATPPTDAKGIAGDIRANTESLQRAQSSALAPELLSDPFDTTNALLLDMGLDEYTRTAIQSTQDIGNLYTGINYLRQLEGEKHLVFVTERGLFLPRLENDYSIAALANDARVVIDTLMTGGIILSGPGSVGSPLPSQRSTAAMQSATNMPRISFSSMYAAQTQRTIANLTGGRFNGYTSSAKTLATIDESSRFEYLLGYAPTNGAHDGTFRRIAVTVKRPGAQVLFRHGYYARRDDTPLDRRAFMTNNRIAAAANMDAALTDLVIAATTDYRPGAPDANLTISVKPDRIAFEHASGRHTASLQIAMFAGDDRQSLVGEHWQTMDLYLTDENYQKFLAQGLSFTQRIAVQGNVKYVKVIAYDYAADRLGTVTITLLPAEVRK